MDKKSHENEVENYLIREVEKRGGKAYKFVSPGQIGVPGNASGDNPLQRYIVSILNIRSQIISESRKALIGPTSAGSHRLQQIFIFGRQQEIAVGRQDISKYFRCHWIMTVFSEMNRRSAISLL